MKTYQEFILEDLRLVSNRTQSSLVQKGSKYDILKTSHDDEYSDKEILFYNLMKKDSTLFCKFFKISKEKVLTEQLDIKLFKKTILKEFNDCRTKLEKNLTEVKLKLKDKTLNIEQFQSNILEYKKLDELDEFLEDYFHLKGLANIKKLVKLYEKNKFLNFLNTNFKEYRTLYQYFDKCYKIITFFNEITTERFSVDLHIGNFGFRKGSREILSFDPVYV